MVWQCIEATALTILLAVATNAAAQVPPPAVPIQTPHPIERYRNIGISAILDPVTPAKLA